MADNGSPSARSAPGAPLTAALVLPYADTEEMSLHLAEIARNAAPGAHALLVLDGAGWHGAGQLEPPDNLTLLLLPALRPRSTPSRTSGTDLRKNKLAITFFDTYDDIVDTCCAPGTSSPTIPTLSPP